MSLAVFLLRTICPKDTNAFSRGAKQVNNLVSKLSMLGRGEHVNELLLFCRLLPISSIFLFDLDREQRYCMIW